MSPLPENPVIISLLGHEGWKVILRDPIAGPDGPVRISQDAYDAEYKWNIMGPEDGCEIILASAASHAFASRTPLSEGMPVVLAHRSVKKPETAKWVIRKVDFEQNKWVIQSATTGLYWCARAVESDEFVYLKIKEEAESAGYSIHWSIDK